MADRITLTGVEQFGYHGVFEQERERGQMFTTDVVCWLNFPAEDDLAGTVNYAELANLARRVIAGQPRRLVETVAQEIADTIMNSYPLVHATEVTIHKPAAPIDGVFADVSVTARRSRKRMRSCVP